MSIIRDFGSPFNVVDYTRAINIIPNTWGTIGQLGIFQETSVAEQTVAFQEINKDFGIVLDRVRGDRSNVNKDYSRKIHTFAIPHFPLDDQILPKDIQGKSAYEDLSAADSLEAVRMRKMERIRLSHAATLEKARAQAIVSGTVYAPNGTVVQDWNAEFGVSRTSIDFLLGTPATEVTGKIEQAIAAIQDNSGMVMITGVVCLCSPEWFAKLIIHPTIKQAYQYYTSTQEPLRQRVTANGNSATAYHREFFHMGVRFIEMRDAYNGTRLLNAGEAYFLPTGTDAFVTYFAPAERFGLVNTLGEQVYYFENPAPNGTAIEIESESNMVNCLLRPNLVVTATSST